VTPKHLHGFLASDVVLQKPSGTPRSKGSVNKIKTSLKAFFSWLEKVGVLTVNPASGIRIKYYQRVTDPRALPDIYNTPQKLDQRLSNLRGV